MDKPLRVAFQGLFSISSQKKETISNVGWFEGLTWRWTLSWKRELTSEEQQQLVELQDILVHRHPMRNERDRVQWGTKESFSVRDLILKANNLLQDGAAVDSLVCTVWSNIAPPKVELMLWLALLERLNTKDLLVRKGILPSQVNVCNFCAQQQEDVDHLLLNC